MNVVEEKKLWIDDDNYKNSSIYTALSEENKSNINFFSENGYIVFKNDIGLALIDDYLANYQSWRDSNSEYLSNFIDDEGHLPRVINLHEKFDALKRVFTSSKALAFQDLLFQQETIMYTSLFFERGTSQPIHRDIPYFWTNPSNHYFGMWVALEDATPRNGALMGVPKAHKIIDEKRDKYLDTLNRSSESIKPIDHELWEAYQSDLKGKYTAQGLKAKHISLDKGDVILWHPLFPHGGGVINKPTPTRKSIVFHTIPKDIAVYQADVFFNPEKLVPEAPKWSYSEYENRLFIKRNINIGHNAEFDHRKIKWVI